MAMLTNAYETQVVQSLGVRMVSTALGPMALRQLSPALQRRRAASVRFPR